MRSAGYVAPRDADEVLVAAVFGKLLGVARVGALDGFFDLGGHSLLAVRLVSGLAAATGRELAVRAVFEHPTVEGLARVLAATVGGRAGGDRGGGPVGRAGAVVPAGAAVVPVAPGDGGGGCLQHHRGAAAVGGAGRGGAAGGAGGDRGAAREPADAVRAGGRPSGAGDRGGGRDRADGGGRHGAVGAALGERVAAVLGAPFDLERGPLFRAHLLRRGADEHVLLLGGHHTVLDGWSVGLLLREASALYRGRDAGGAGSSMPTTRRGSGRR